MRRFVILVIVGIVIAYGLIMLVQFHTLLYLGVNPLAAILCSLFAAHLAAFSFNQHLDILFNRVFALQDLMSLMKQAELSYLLDGSSKSYLACNIAIRNYNQNRLWFQPKLEYLPLL